VDFSIKGPRSELTLAPLSLQNNLEGLPSIFKIRGLGSSGVRLSKYKKSFCIFLFLEVIMFVKIYIFLQTWVIKIERKKDV